MAHIDDKTPSLWESAEKIRDPKIVIISWPEDPDRGIEPYGPFEDAEAQQKFVIDCQEAAGLGWYLLQGAEYLITALEAPFDPAELSSDAVFNVVGDPGA